MKVISETTSDNEVRRTIDGADVGVGVVEEETVEVMRMGMAKV